MQLNLFLSSFSYYFDTSYSLLPDKKGDLQCGYFPWWLRKALDFVWVWKTIKIIHRKGALLLRFSLLAAQIWVLVALYLLPSMFYAFCRLFQPTPAHYFIKLLEDKGLLLRNFTQVSTYLKCINVLLVVNNPRFDVTNHDYFFIQELF